MKRSISLLLLLVMLFSSLLTFTSCKPKDDGAEINIYLGAQVFDFDPSDYYVSTNAERILSLVYEPLFTVNKRGKVKCAAADKYKIDKDERTITIELRESYWSDGVRVKAADFVYAWCERIISPENPNPAASLFLEIEGVREAMKGEISISDVGIVASEPYQLTITYRSGADAKRILKNLASVATSPVRKDMVEESETTWSKSSLVSNGPFKLKSYDREAGTFELSRNLGYHQKPDVKDYNNKVRPGLLYGEYTFPGSDIAVSYQDIENKVTFVMAEASLADRQAYKKKAKTAEHTSTYTYVFNTSHPLFADTYVRLALSAAIDRNAIINAITFGKAADGLIPDVSGGAEKTLISSGADIAKAQSYLAMANKNVVAANKSFTLTINDDEQSRAIANIVVGAWTQLGFNVTVNAVTSTVSELVGGGTAADSTIQYLIKNATYGKVDYDVIAVDWQTFSTDALAGLASLTSRLGGMGNEQITGKPYEPGVGGSLGDSVARLNIARWADAKYDQMILEASACSDEKERAKLLAEAEAYLMNHMPVCPLVFNETFVFKSSKIRKLKFDGLGHYSFTKVKLRGYRKYFKPEEVQE